MAPRNRAARVRWFLALVVAVLIVGGSVAAYGLVVRGNIAALLPWFSSPDEGPTPVPHTVTGRQTPQPIQVPAPPVAASLPVPQVRPIIFLPGITGSYLTDGTSEVWPNLAGIGSAIECSTQSVDVQQEVQIMSPLGLSAAGMPIAGSTVGVANGVVNPVDGDFGGAIAGATYTKGCGAILDVISFITDRSRSVDLNLYAAAAANAQRSGYTVVASDDAEGLSACTGNPRCFVPVGYDWRLSAESNAAAVLQIIKQILSLTGADRVDILAHSQGGLVAEAITRLPQSVGKIYRIVTLGTPYLGAPKALTDLLYQYPCEDPPQCFLSAAVVQSLVENYPGLMDLLPSADYYTAYSAISPSYSTVESQVAEGLASLTYPAVPQNMSLADAAEQMHASDDSWAPLDPSVGLLRMIGYDANDASPNCDGSSACDPYIGLAPSPGETITSAFNPDGSPAYSASPIYGDGDGTVPLFSANVYNPAAHFDDRGSGRDMYWCGLSHEGLAQYTSVWESAEAYLEGRVSYATDVLGAACPDGGLGTIATLNLVGASGKQPTGAEPPGSALIRSCSPATTAVAPTLSSITFKDDSATNQLDLYWYGPTCRETLYATIPPQMELTQMAYIGDVWHIRLRTSGVLIGTAIASATPQTIVAVT
jgi:pimeloyl-ACP methyl ester carboxylesterase